MAADDTPDLRDRVRSAPGTDDPPSRAPGRVDRVLSVLGRVLPVARGVRFAVTVLAAVAAGGVAALGLAWATHRTPADPLEWLVLVVLCGVLLVPSGLLLGARWMVSGLIQLPDRLRAEPGVRRDQIDQLTALAAGERSKGAAGGTDGAGVPSGGPVRRAWSAGRLLVGARGDLLTYTALLRVLSWSYLASTFVAAGLAALEVLILYPAALVVVLLG